MHAVPLFMCIFTSTCVVYGSSPAASDASEASARPGLPATRPPQEGPPLHLHPGPLLGSALDPQVHCGRYYIPRHGERHLH